VTLPKKAHKSQRADFSDLVVTLSDAPELSELAEIAASGQVIDAVQLVGLAGPNDDTAVTAYDLRLNEVVMTEIKDTNDVDQLGFSYGQISLTTTSITDGSETSQVFSWDLVDGPGTEEGKEAMPGDGTEGGGPLSYYLLIDGLNGGSGRVEGAFEISSYEIDISRLTDVGSGRSATRADFSDLLGTLSDAPELSELAEIAASGQIIDAVQLVGLAGPKDDTAYDLRLNDVVMTEVKDTDDVDQLAFAYGQISLTTTSTPDDGSEGISQVFSWDLA